MLIDITNLSILDIIKFFYKVYKSYYYFKMSYANITKLLSYLNILILIFQLEKYYSYLTIFRFLFGNKR